MDDDQLVEIIDGHVHAKNYHAAVNVLKNMKDLDLQSEISSRYLCYVGVENVVERFGEVHIFENKEEYEKVKRGEGDVPKQIALYKGPDDVMEGLEDMIEFVPDDNPLKKFYLSLEDVEKDSKTQ